MIHLALFFFLSTFMCRVNVCPYQGSRTIRTEEAILISLARLSPFVSSNKQTMPGDDKTSSEGRGTDDASDKDAESGESSAFSDDDPSDESSVE